MTAHSNFVPLSRLALTGIILRAIACAGVPRIFEIGYDLRSDHLIVRAVHRRHRGPNWGFQAAIEWNCLKDSAVAVHRLASLFAEAYMRFLAQADQAYIAEAYLSRLF